MPIIKTNVTQQVTEHIRRRIDSGLWKPGEKIDSENSLAQELGASRTSVRLAIRQFIALGILESRHGIGTYLMKERVEEPLPFSSISPADCRNIADVVHFRLAVEPETSYLAALNADEAAMEKMRSHIENLKASVGDVGKYVKFDMAFHLEVARSSGNALLAKSLTAVFNGSEIGFQNVFRIFEYKGGGGIYYHSQILKAISQRDPKRARRVMKDHVKGVRQLIGKRLGIDFNGR